MEITCVRDRSPEGKARARRLEELTQFLKARLLTAEEKAEYGQLLQAPPSKDAEIVDLKL